MNELKGLTPKPGGRLIVNTNVTELDEAIETVRQMGACGKPFTFEDLMPGRVELCTKKGEHGTCGPEFMRGIDTGLEGPTT